MPKCELSLLLLLRKEPWRLPSASHGSVRLRSSLRLSRWFADPNHGFIGLAPARVGSVIPYSLFPPKTGIKGRSGGGPVVGQSNSHVARNKTPERAEARVYACLLALISGGIVMLVAAFLLL